MIENILLFVSFVLLIAFIFITSYLEDRKKKSQEDYVNTLNEHDKSVITTYNLKGRYFKRYDVKRKKKVKQD